MSLLKTNEIQNYNGSSLTLTASTVSTSAQLNTGGNISVTGSLNVSDDSTTRTNLGLGTIATQDSDSIAVTGGSVTGTEIDLKSSGTTIYKSDGATAVLSESGGVVTLTADEANVGSNALVVNSSGDVGIGTSPDRTLHVNSGGTNGIATFESTDATGIVWVADGNSANTSQVGLGAVTDDMLLYAGGSERMRIDSSGNIIINSTFISGEREVRAYAGTDDFTYIFGRNVADSSGVFRCEINGDARIKLTAAGDGYFDGTGDLGAADYAEYFEWLDGNPNNDDRRGYPVVLESGKIRIATSSDNAEDIIGIISARPAIVGDTASLGWQGKFATDEFGERLKRPITVYSWTDENGNELQYRQDSIPEDVTVPDDADSDIRYEDFYSDEYDPTVEYVPRTERPEWSPVGLLGKLRMRTGQPTGTRWIKLRDISETIELWFIR